MCDILICSDYNLYGNLQNFMSYAAMSGYNMANY